jgi:hypothetical protein
MQGTHKSYDIRLIISKIEYAKHFENPPNLLIWFYIFEVKNKIKTFGYMQPEGFWLSTPAA